MFAISSSSIEISKAALFLDLDGTLAPIAPLPSDVGPDPQRSSLLRRAAAALGGRLAVISGRSIEDIDRILEGCTACVAGVHGLERRTPGGMFDAIEPHPALQDAVEVLGALAGAQQGLLLEEKSRAVALHFRGAPAAETAIHEAAERLAERTGLVLQKGSMVVELKSPGADKGDAVRAFMAEPPFVGASPIFVGDDLTDEAGFAAASQLGGAGVLVGPPRKSAAQARLQDPEAVMAWIEAALTSGVFELEGWR